jgi:predicted Rossmann fold nucleotide-binding protein DprA/Smf involved in DNA uptake
MVYNLMSDGNCTLDELTNHCELMPSKILVALTELELEGIITKTADSYRIV